MLEEMRIRDLGVIEDAEVELGPGLTVITGETGAGKTMVVHGLALLLGGRADGSRVRPGAARAVLEGRFLLPPDGAAAERAAAAGAVLDDGALLVTRTVTAEGRSRAHVGGTAVPAAVLAAMAEDLVAVHGQADQWRLRRPAEQRAVVDEFGGPALLELLGRYRQRYRELAETQARWAELTGRYRERAQEADLLRFGVAEVAAAQLRPGEDAELARSIERLGSVDALRRAAASAHAILAGPLPGEGSAEAGGRTGGEAADVLTAVAAARRALEQVAGQDPALATLAERVAEAGYVLSDAGAELASYSASLEADPAALAAAQDRLALIATLSRKYAGDPERASPASWRDARPDVAGVLAWADRAGARLVEVTGDDDRIAGLEEFRESLRRELADLADSLRSARRSAAERFGAAATAELVGLAMPHARVTVEVRDREAPDGADGLDVGGRLVAFGPHGVDEVAVLLHAHPGAAPAPLHRAASGGELSRVMLAVEVILAAAAEDRPVATFVFDEVDAGVGGKAAVEVGRRLSRLAASAQVIVVTHLPQVAAFADRHLLVAKSAEESVARTDVRELRGPDRVRELSRMLAGQEDSASAQAHAQELLAVARNGDGRSRPRPRQRAPAAG